MGFFSSIGGVFSDIGNFIGGGITGSIGKIGIGGELLSGDFLDAAINDILNNPKEFGGDFSMFGDFWGDVKESWDKFDRSFVEALILYIFGKEVFGKNGQLDQQKLTQEMQGGLMSQIESGISDAMKSSWGDFATEFSNVFTGITKDIGNVSNGIENLVAPIGTAINDITKTVNKLNDSVVSPIKDLIDAYNKATTTDLDKLTADLHNGFTGILQLPTDLSNAFTSVDAQFARATQALGDSNRDIVTNDLVPGLSEGIGAHLNKIRDVLLGPEFKPVTGAAIVQKLHLTESQSQPELVALIEKLEDEIENHTGFFGDVLRGMFHILQVGDFVFRQMTLSLEPYFQEAKKSIHAELLPVSAATEAYRRGIIDYDSWTEELFRWGFSYERQEVINELTDFYFKERDAVALYQRGIIDRGAFFSLMKQNNVGDDQAQAMIELMQHTLSPADIAAGVARGYIAPDQATNMYQAAMVPEHLRDIIPELEMSLVNPAKMIRYRNRAIVANDGFLTTSLQSPVPDNIKAQFDRMQAEPGAAELEWLAHFDVPQARWWCVAYFRGLVTLTQVEQAFQALNIPQELWYNIIDTERELPPVWLVPDIVKTGVWKREQAIPTLMKLGYDEENATVLYDYGAAQIKSANTQAAENLSKISLGNAKAAYDDGLIDEATYKDVLLAHNYDQASADLTVEIAQYNLAVSQQKENADTIVSAVKLGQISEADAQSALYNLQLTTAQVEGYLNKIDAAKRANAKLPSVSMLESMVKKSIIDAQTAAQTLVLLGYAENWALNIIKSWG